MCTIGGNKSCNINYIVYEVYMIYEVYGIYFIEMWGKIENPHSILVV